MEIELSAKKYQRIINKALAGFAIMDGDGTVVMANQALADLLGYPRHRLVEGRFSLIDCFAGELSEYKIFHAALMADRGVRNYQGIFRRKNGETFPVLINSNFVELDGKDYIEAVFVADTNNGQSKGASKREDTELGMLRFIVDNAAGEIYLVREDMSLSYVNNSACKSLGYSRKDMFNMNISRFDLDFTPEIWQKYFKGMKESRRSTTVETRHRDSSGNIRIKEVTSRYIEDESRGKEYILGFAIDITEHKALKTELVKSERRFRRLFELAPDGVVVISPDDKMAFWNLAAKNMLGYSDDELRKMSVQDLFPHIQDIFQIKGFVAKGNDSIKIESPIKKKDGTIFSSAVTIWVERDGAGEIIFTYGIIRDISKAKKLEKERLELEKLSAIKILLNKSEQEREELEDSILQNINTIVLPILDKLKSTQSPEISQNYLNLLEENLEKISSPFLKKLSVLHQKFSPREVEVANLIRSGRGTKEIAEILLLTPTAINFHRKNIRRKLGLISKKLNLQVYLKSLG